MKPRFMLSLTQGKTHTNTPWSNQEEFFNHVSRLFLPEEVAKLKQNVSVMLKRGGGHHFVLFFDPSPTNPCQFVQLNAQI